MKVDDARTAAVDVARCSTGIPGLDEVLGGGLPRNCLYLVQGDPGTGKTTLALQFLLEGRRRGESVFYITLSESRAELENVARSHGWTLDGVPLMELTAIESLLRPESQTTVFHAAEIELNRIAAYITSEVRRHAPSRIVFDSLSEFRLLAETPLRYRRQLLTIKQEFTRLNATLLLLDDRMENANIPSDPHVLSLAHGVIDLQELPHDYGSTRRRMRVSKLRGVHFREGFHDYTIRTGGMRIFPRLNAAEHQETYTPEPVSSGVAGLDQLLGGGMDRGTTTLILGPAGSGKSTLSLQYASQLVGRGERCVVYAFDELRSLLLARATALGINLGPQKQESLLSIMEVSPAELAPGEFVCDIVERVKAGCRLVVIDSLNGYINAMPGEKFLNSQLHELCAYLDRHGVMTILIMAQHGLVAGHEVPADLSYLADTVVTLRFFETAGEVKQAIAVFKKRSGQHERTIREFRLDGSRGIRVGEPLRGFEGVLSGVPTFIGPHSEMLKT